MQRNQSIDLIKIIAMIMVVGLHVEFGGGLEKSELLTLQYGISLIAIPLFFMVSGYLMQSKMPSYTYVGKKIWGIIRFVMIVVSFTCVCTGIIVHHPRIHSIYLWFIGGGNCWQFWYFGSLIIIYLLAPLMCRLISSTKAKWGLIATSLVCLIMFFLNWRLDFERTYTYQTFRLWNWCFYFMLGCWIKQYGAPKIHWLIPILLAFNSALIVGHGPVRGVEYYHCSVLCAVYAYATFVFILGLNIKDNKAISELSKLFLPVYVVHPFLYQAYANVVILNYPPPLRLCHSLHSSTNCVNSNKLCNNENTYYE